MNGVSGLSGPHWRRVMAALASREARTAYAQIVLGEDVLPDAKEQRRSKAIGMLLEAGLVEWSGDKGLEASDAVFRDLLSQHPKRQPKTGVDRFLRLGRIDRYPASPADRRQLLAWVVGQAIKPGEDLTERQVNERLLNYTDDVVLLRRYLVDFELLERTASGSSYRRPAEEPA
ncbi:DUF2087 domain-containing protein [Arthrobacter nitrophenolicus]